MLSIVFDRFILMSALYILQEKNSLIDMNTELSLLMLTQYSCNSDLVQNVDGSQRATPRRKSTLMCKLYSTVLYSNYLRRTVIRTAAKRLTNRLVLKILTITIFGRRH